MRDRETLTEAVESERLLLHELAAYEGKWVAVRDHHVVATAGSLAGLLRMIGPENDVEACFQVIPSGGLFS